MTMIRKVSSLSSYDGLSPNKTSPRKSSIKRLTPHCVAGNLSIERTLGLPNFMTPRSPGASCNYAIGSDGRIGLGVIESDAAWTSNSSFNDNQAITFEIANSAGAPNWPMTDLAINSFVKLSVDICRFYGFKKVHYENKPSNVTTKDKVEEWIKTWEKLDEMIITLHRWYAPKECPGQYFINKLPDIVKRINQDLSSEIEPFQVKITAETLNARYGPGTNFPIIKTFRNNHDIHTITDVSNGLGAKKWGKIKSFNGWTALDFTENYKPVSKFTPYKIKINVNTLRVRKGPGTNFPIAMTLRFDKNTYTIIEESSGAGAKKWGKLKSGVGWISLDFTRKV